MIRKMISSYFACLWLAGCAAQLALTPTASPSLPVVSITEAAPTFTPTIALLRTPAPTATASISASIQPTLQPTLAATPQPPTCKFNASTYVPANARVVNMFSADTDGDGQSEWLIFYQEAGVGRGRVIRCVGDDGLTFALGGATPVELFADKLDAVWVRDVNQDGRNEIMVKGVLRGKAEVAHVFRWDGAMYAMLLALTGAEGVAFDNAQNANLYDFTALQLLFPRSIIIRATHAEWARDAYALEHDVLFLLGAPATFNYPEEATLAYYTFWQKREADEMFRLLSATQKTRTSLAALQQLCSSVDEVRVEQLTVDEETPAQATVSTQVRLKAHGQAQTLNPVWRLQKEGGSWRLTESQP